MSASKETLNDLCDIYIDGIHPNFHRDFTEFCRAQTTATTGGGLGLVVGETGVGKTEEVRRSLSALGGWAGYVAVPPGVSSAQLLQLAARALSDRQCRTRTGCLAEIEHAAQQARRVLVLDDANRLRSPRSKGPYIVSHVHETLVYLAKTCGLTLVLVGTPRLLELASCPEVATLVDRRIDVGPLPVPWEQPAFSHIILRWLNAAGSHLTLEPDRDLSRKLYEVSGGRIGPLTKVLRYAVTFSRLSNQELGEIHLCRAIERFEHSWLSAAFARMPTSRLSRRQWHPRHAAPDVSHMATQLLKSEFAPLTLPSGRRTRGLGIKRSGQSSNCERKATE